MKARKLTEHDRQALVEMWKNAVPGLRNRLVVENPDAVTLYRLRRLIQLGAIIESGDTLFGDEAGSQTFVFGYPQHES
jgi:hypothetical protein